MLSSWWQGSRYMKYESTLLGQDDVRVVLGKHICPGTDVLWSYVVRETRVLGGDRKPLPCHMTMPGIKHRPQQWQALSKLLPRIYQYHNFWLWSLDSETEDQIIRYNIKLKKKWTQRKLLMRVYTVCPDLSVQKLRIITYFCRTIHTV